MKHWEHLGRRSRKENVVVVDNAEQHEVVVLDDESEQEIEVVEEGRGAVKPKSRVACGEYEMLAISKACVHVAKNRKGMRGVSFWMNMNDHLK